MSLIEAQLLAYRTAIQLVHEGTMPFYTEVTLPVLGTVIVKTVALFDTGVVDDFVAEIKKAMIANGSFNDLCGKYDL